MRIEIEFLDREISKDTAVQTVIFLESVIINSMTRTRISTTRPTSTLNNRKRRAARLAILAGAYAVYLVGLSYNKTPRNTSKLSGADWLDELLEGHDTRFYDNMGMNRHVYCWLLEILGKKAGLRDTKHVTLREQLAIFLYFAVTGVSVRKLQERFQRSPDTISRCQIISLWSPTQK